MPQITGIRDGHRIITTVTGPRGSASISRIHHPDCPCRTQTALPPAAARPAERSTVNFNDAIRTVIAELTPQPWDYMTHDGTRLRVIPEGLAQDPGDGVVLIQICEAAHVQAAPEGPEFSVRTSDMPELIAALDARTEWTVRASWGEELVVRPAAEGMRLAYTVWGRDTTGQGADVDRTVLVPEAQRLPLASALRRALDVARGWEDPA